MVVIADSSVVNYLILIDAAGILPAAFGEILIPQAVLAELQRPRTPASVASWIADRPTWLHVHPATPALDQHLEKLGPGERESISLATMHMPDVLLLMDEAKGRQEAERRHIRFMGTLGVLDKAAAASLIDLPTAIDRLLQTSFYVTPGLLKAVLDQDSLRRNSSVKE